MRRALLADDESRYSIDELHLLQVPEGRCPHCGRPAEASEKKVFEELRETAAQANKDRDDAQAQARELEEQVNLSGAKLIETEERLRAVRGMLRDEGAV